tara:strand:+ start:3477 stop:4070 length:594 start_codon:yes stop_codon:yes gene_type:complete
MPNITKHLASTQFKSYNDYINSEAWRNRKALYKISHPKRCFICDISKKIIELHHITYERMGNELDKDLVWLCQKHHAKVHRYKKMPLDKRHLALKKKFDNQKQKKRTSSIRLSVWGNPLVTTKQEEKKKALIGRAKNKAKTKRRLHLTKEDKTAKMPSTDAQKDILIHKLGLTVRQAWALNRGQAEKRIRKSGYESV